MNLKDTLTNVTSKTSAKLQAHAPDILMGVGLVAGGLAIYSAIKNTLSAEPIIDETKEELDAIKAKAEKETVVVRDENGVEVSEVVTVNKADLTKVYLKAGGKLLGHYYPTILFSMISATCILYSTGMMKKRTAQAIAAYNTLDTIFKKYRGNVVEKYGEEVDHQMRYGLKEEKVDVVEYDENGNEVKSKKKVTTIPSDFLNTSEYSRIFSPYVKEGVPNVRYEKVPEANALFLQNTQRYCNDLLKLRGHLFLNEVYDMLGFDRTESGQVVGWIKGEGDDVVRFGIDNIYHAIRMGDVKYEEGILLDFNVQGIIIDKI